MWHLTVTEKSKNCGSKRLRHSVPLIGANYVNEPKLCVYCGVISQPRQRKSYIPKNKNKNT